MLAKIIVTESGEGHISSEEVKALGLAPESRVEAEIIVKKIEKPLTPLEIPDEKTLQDVLNEYEEKYGMTSDECSTKLRNDEIEENVEFLEWMGFYKLAKRALARGDRPSEMKFKPAASSSQ